MVRGPDTTHALVDTRDGLVGALQLLAAGLLQQERLVEYLLGLEVADADHLLSAVDVVALDDGVLVRSGGNSDLDLRVAFGEAGERVLQEAPVGDIISIAILSVGSI